MNEHSSRSHTILTVHIHSEEKASSGDNNGVFITRNGKINFVDLAGYVLHIIKTIMYISICIMIIYNRGDLFDFLLDLDPK